MCVYCIYTNYSKKKKDSTLNVEMVSDKNYMLLVLFKSHFVPVFFKIDIKCENQNYEKMFFIGVTQTKITVQNNIK